MLQCQHRAWYPALHDPLPHGRPAGTAGPPFLYSPHALPTPTAILRWPSGCSPSGLSALKVTGDKAPATTKDQALLQLCPHLTLPFSPHGPQGSQSDRAPGAHSSLSPSTSPFLSFSLIYFNLLCFPRWLFSISW